MAGGEGRWSAMQGPAEWNPAPSDLKSTCMQAAEHAEAQGVALPRLALKHSMKSAMEAGIAITLVGMSTPEEVRGLYLHCMTLAS